MYIYICTSVSFIYTIEAKLVESAISASGGLSHLEYMSYMVFFWHRQCMTLGETFFNINEPQKREEDFQVPG